MSGELIYDGDCGFCRKCVVRWKQIVGERERAIPYQEFAPLHPEIPLEEFRRAVQFMDQDGRRFSGAEAIFESVKEVPGYGFLAWAYNNVPLIAPASDWIYSEVAGHRKTATWFTRKLWGATLQKPEYETSVWLFRRVLAILYLIAFLSFGVQVRGLIGSQGILPISEYLDAVRQQVGFSRFMDAPTIFWWWQGDAALEWACWIGAMLAFVCALGIMQRAMFVALFVLYLSLVTAGQVFMGYQWDFLLLEIGFLAIFITASPPRVWLGRWLLFRLMFESGCVKLLSHDPTWANLTALSYHYWTQPLPTPLAWYAAQAPMWFQKFSTLSVFVIELAAPFLIFGPRRLKQIAASAFVLLQTMIMLTGNYTCFNLLAITLCLFLLDDEFWGRFGARFPRFYRRPRRTDSSRFSRAVSAGLGVLILVISCTELASMFTGSAPRFAAELVVTLSPFGIVNSYGLFATMTTQRIEIEVQGSDDGENWRTYGFRYKPEDIHQTPRWVAPHQPRLDWQMWFAALGTHQENPWFSSFMVRLLTASPEVLRLLESDPFFGQRPKYVRALAFDYHFSTGEERASTHAWWSRQFKGTYFPPVSLKSK